jgi:SpoVK/Ycf46/Vps4 family AAA+-type ATPase
LLDPALKRDGRCDLRVALLPPTKDQLALICKASFKQYPEMKAEIENWEPFVGRCEGYNGANMVEIVRRAWTRANKIDKKAITPEEMEWALKDYIPQRADNKEIAEMALISIENCSSQSLLPSNYKELEKQYSKYFVKKTLER